MLILLFKRKKKVKSYKIRIYGLDNKNKYLRGFDGWGNFFKLIFFIRIVLY